ncbi:hypothetical protein BHE74_00035784, partial [Ensete ventricosum]
RRSTERGNSCCGNDKGCDEGSGQRSNSGQRRDELQKRDTGCASVSMDAIGIDDCRHQKEEAI